MGHKSAVGGAAVARAHMNEVKRRLKEEKNAKDEDVLVSLQLVNEMLVRGYEFLPIELGKSRGSQLHRGGRQGPSAVLRR